MMKYSITLLTSIMLFSGCGGGGTTNNSPQDSLSSLSTQNDIRSITQNLRNAGYTNASDVVAIDTNTIAFTYYQQDNKHFVVYNKNNGQVLSDIASFKGDVVTSNTSQQITFDNGTTVNVQNHTKAKVESTQTYATSSTQKTPKEIINTQLSNGEYVRQFVYTPQRQGAAVLLQKPGNVMALYMYGLENKANPKREFVIYTPQEDGERIENIQMIGNGQVKFTSRYNNYTYIITYNYLQHYTVSQNEIRPDGSTNNQQNTSTSLIEQFKNDINNFEWSYSSHVLSPQGNGAIVLAMSDGGIFNIYRYGISNNKATKEALLISENTNITNLKMTGNGKFSYQIRGNTIVYDYINKYQVSSTSNNQNNTMSIRQVIENTVRQQTGGSHELVDYTYTNSRQGMLALSYNDRNEHFLYRFGLNNGTPVYEKKFTLGTVDYRGSLAPLSNGQVRINYGNGTFTQTYNYIGGYEVNSGSNQQTNNTSSVEDAIRNKLSSEGISLQTYSYSQGRGGIIAIGKSGSNIRFYRFNAQPVEHERTFYMNNLPEYLEFYSIAALSGGEFRITTSDRDIVFNYFTGNYSY